MNVVMRGVLKVKIVIMSDSWREYEAEGLLKKDPF